MTKKIYWKQEKKKKKKSSIGLERQALRLFFCHGNGPQLVTRSYSQPKKMMKWNCLADKKDYWCHDCLLGIM